MNDLKLIFNIFGFRQFVRLGEYDFSKNPDCYDDTDCSDALPYQDIMIDYKVNVVVHPKYEAFQNDIAIIQLTVDAKTNQRNINTIALPVNGNLPESGFLIIFPENMHIIF